MKVTLKACLWQGAWLSVLGIPLSDSVINYINEKRIRKLANQDCE